MSKVKIYFTGLDEHLLQFYQMTIK